jgi:CcmD family protein
MDARNVTFMFYGFAAVWVILCAYVISLVAREHRIKRQLEGLQRLMEDREGAPEARGRRP